MLKGENPNCIRTVCRNPVGESWVWLICATTASICNSCKNVSIRVVLPAPISPVITTNPSVNQIVDSMYALARACCLLRYRNCGSGLSRKGSSFSLNSSRYMCFYYWRDAAAAAGTPALRSIDAQGLPGASILRDAGVGGQCG